MEILRKWDEPAIRVLMMPRDTNAYKRYIDKFEKQETEIEEFQGTIKKLQDAEQRQRQAFEAYLESLGVERRDQLPV